MGGHYNTYPFHYDEEKDDNLDAVAMSTWHYNTHLVIYNEKKRKRKEMGVSNPIRLENKIRKNISIGLGPGEAMRSQETSPI